MGLSPLQEKRTKRPGLPPGFLFCAMATALKGADKVMGTVRQKVNAIPMLGALGQMGLGKMGMGNSNMAQSLANLDLTGFAVGGALEGIFHYMGQQEADIRSNPAARSTSLIRKLFG